MSNEVERTIKIVPFTKKSIWTVWSRQFLARAHLKGYKGILDGTIKVPGKGDRIDITSETGRKRLEARKQNINAYNELILSFDDMVNFNLVNKAVNAELPDGDAFLAWKNLKSKHEPNTAANKVGLKLEFSQSKMTDIKKDPEEWVSELEIIRIKLSDLKVEMTDEDIIIHIINNMPSEYETVTDILENELNQDSFTVSNVKTVLES